MDAPLRHRGEVVGAERAELDGELGSTHPLELVGVEFERHAVPPGGQQNLARLGDGEHPGLAEHVTTPGETFPRDRGQHLITQQPHVLRAARAMLGRHLMSAEERRYEIEPLLRRQRAHDAQLLALGLEIQAVARLHLDGRAAVGAQREQPGPGELPQIGFAAATGVADRLQDPAAGGGNRLVVLAQRPALVIVEPWHAEHGVGVTIDESRQEDALDFFDHGVPAPLGRAAQFPVRADGGDAAALDSHRGIAEDFDLGQLTPPAGTRRTAAGDDLPGSDEQGTQSAASRIGRRRPWRRAASRASG